MKSVRYGHMLSFAILIILVGIFPLVDLLASSALTNFQNIPRTNMGKLKFLGRTNVLLDSDSTWMFTVFSLKLHQFSHPTLQS